MMELLLRRPFNLIITTGKSASTNLLHLPLLLLLATIIPYHVTIALPEGTFPVAKRMNIETCLVRFDVHLNTIIRTEESRSMGARFLDDADLNSREQCLRLCCETDNCDVFVFEEKSPGTCFLFQCGPPENFRCKFTRHSNYTSAVLSIPPPPPMEQPPQPPPLAAQIQSLAASPPASNSGPVTKPLSQHEMELVSLKDGGGKNGANAAPPVSSTTPLPPLGVRLGEMPATTPSVSTPKQLPPQQCGHFEFPCHSGECIAVYNVCDGIPQCEDGSDEGTECPQKNASPVGSSSAVQQGSREQGSGLGLTNVNVGSVNQPVMMIPSIRTGTGGNGGLGMVSQGMMPIDQRMYQPLDYQQPPNRFSLSLSEQQQQQQLGKSIMHRNREDPMTAPKPWPRPVINEPNYVDTPDSHIFNHKGGLQLSPVNGMVPASQQYQETLPSDPNYMPSSSVVRAGGSGKSYLALPGGNNYPQQVLPQFLPEQPQQQPPYKALIPSQWLQSSGNVRSGWPMQPGDSLPSGADGGAPPQEQYIQPPVQQHRPAVQDMQSTSNGADASSSIAMQQQQPYPANGQWATGSQTVRTGTPTPNTAPAAAPAAAAASLPDTSAKDSSASQQQSLPSSSSGTVAAQNGSKHKPPAGAAGVAAAANDPSDGGAEYEDDAYEDTYPESSQNAAASGGGEDQPPTQTEAPKKKLRKHHKHDHAKQGSSTGAAETDTANEQTEQQQQQKKKKKTKTIKKDKAAHQAEDHGAGGHHTASDTIVHEHLKALHKDLEIEFADHDGYADRPGGAMLSLTLGVLLTAAMGILLSCRMRVARRRIRRPGKSSYAHDADFLVNGMYL